MKLRAYKTVNPRRALRVSLVSDYLDRRTLKKYRTTLDCLSLSPEIYISIFSESHYPVVNIDEYFNYIELMGIDLSEYSEAREESFSVLLGILETNKVGFEKLGFSREVQYIALFPFFSERYIILSPFTIKSLIFSSLLNRNFHEILFKFFEGE